MHCYRLENDKILKGLPATAFPVANAEVKSGFIEEAAVSLIIPEEIDVKVFHTELEDDNTNCWQFGQAWLQQPRSKKAVSDKLLLAIDWTDYWPDSNLGDESILISWKGTYALYACKPNSTYIRNRSSGEIFINKKGTLENVPAEKYEELRAAKTRRKTVASIKHSNVLLDYVLE